MSFFSIFSDFFDSLFRSSSPEVKAKQALKKVESDLKSSQPAIYKNDNILPSVGEAFYVLYQQTKIIDDILSETLFSEDLHRNAKYSDLLISTGFSSECKDLLNQLSYEQRKIDAQATERTNRWADNHRNKLEQVLRYLKNKEFLQIEKVINNLQILHETCKFNFLSPLRQFDRTFSPDVSDSMPNFSSVPIGALEDIFLDLYYLVANLEITSSTARAILVLEEQRRGSHLDSAYSDKIVLSLKKISSIFRRILTPVNLKNFIMLAKHDINVNFSEYSCKTQAVSNYSQRLQTQFNTDEQRIKTELKDNLIAEELKNLFGIRPLIDFFGYNNDLDNLLQRNGIQPLLFILPLQISKSFVEYFFSESILNFLNGIIVEGFFNNSTYKTNFSEAVFACTEASNKIHNFEQEFAKGGDLDLALIKSYVAEGHQNPDLIKKLTQLIELANIRAFNLLEYLAPSINTLYKLLDTMLTDAKRSKPEYITNIKVLFMSSRNRDTADILEKEYPFWKNYLEIMKNYVIINKTEK